MIGKTLSHFTITAKLGEGGMGEVCRLEDTEVSAPKDLYWPTSVDSSGGR